ncbi:MAG: hydrogenase maturation nickel metallochaperone HypA [Pseudomonadota bacterium]
MHEMTLCRQIVATVSETIDKHMTPTCVRLAIGKLALVDTESLRFWFPIIAKEQLGASPQLTIDTVAAVACCQDCQHEFTIEQRLSACPNCHSYHYRLCSGDELMIKTVEVE